MYLKPIIRMQNNMTEMVATGRCLNKFDLSKDMSPGGVTCFPFMHTGLSETDKTEVTDAGTVHVCKKSTTLQYGWGHSISQSL